MSPEEQQADRGIERSDSADHPADGAPRAAGDGIHIQAYARDHAGINVAGRDQHFHYVDGVRKRRRTEAGSSVPDCPYPGLAAFGPEHERWFFGREALVAELTDRLDQRMDSGRLQAVVAPSGAGKSSLLRAGLLPHLDQAALPDSDRWPKLLLTPSAHPLRALADQIVALRGVGSEATAADLVADPPRCLSVLAEALRNDLPGQPARVVIVVDQFEELFTLCTDEQERRSFVTLLARLAGGQTDTGTAGTPQALVVLGIRSDFYAACVDYPPLRAALQDAPLVVGPMTDEELREAVLLPAMDVGLDVEDGLVELLLHDLGATTAMGPSGEARYEAGRLPLLAHALRVCWQQRHGATLTVRGYRDTGGIQGAIASTADRVYIGLDDDERRVAQSLFLRMVRVGDRAEDVRRRLSRAELADVSGGRAEPVVDAFTRARLLTCEQETVEITHEALLRTWPRLRGWIDADRAGRLTHQNLEEAAATWDESGRDPALLYRGSPLEVARTWALNAPPNSLSSEARAFLAAGERARRRTARLRNAVIAALAVLTLLASGAAGIAFLQQGEALHQRDLAVYNRVVAEADRLRGTDQSLASQLDLVAHRMRPSDETYTRLLNSGNTPLSKQLQGHTERVSSVAFSPDGRTLATGSGDATIRLWDTSDPRSPRALGRPLTGHAKAVMAVAFSPDGRTLATAGDDRDRWVRLWDVSEPSDPEPLGRPLTGHDAVISGVAFSPDGHLLASSSGDATVRLWDVSDPADAKLVGKPLKDGPGRLWAVAFSPDGKTIATGADDFKARLWDVSDPKEPKRRGAPLTGHTNTVASLAFSPDSRTLATGSGDSTVRLWNVAEPDKPTYANQLLKGRSAVISSVAFSPDGRILATASADATVQMWSVSDPARPKALGQPWTGHSNTVSSVAFSPDGLTLASGSYDQTARLWDVPRTLLTGHFNGVIGVAFSPDGRLFATGGLDGAVRLWDTSEPGRPKLLGRGFQAHTAGVRSLAFSPGGKFLASAGYDGVIQLWNISDPSKPKYLGDPLTGHEGGIWTMAFSPDGKTLATGGQDATIRLWDVTDPGRAGPLGRPVRHHEGMVLAVAFSPDGDMLASGSYDTTAQLWDVRDRTGPERVGRPMKGHINGVSSLAFSPDGKTLATGSNDFSVRLWNISSPSHPISLGKPLTGHTDSVFALAFSPDGSTLATGSYGQSSAQLWDVRTPARPSRRGLPLNAHTDSVYAVVFSQDGKTLATGSLDQSARLWQLDVDTSIERICADTEPLSPGQWRRFVGEGVAYAPPCA
ncbi:hypothetical protein ACFUAG_22680 [Streptomyces sp. NPDC057193]|uniref:nSTAND1 domain-containing NTPase n=1 Tax=Streptomyces sp. NPDC057193 TaxID=3346043 RepID=UPI003629CF18